MRLTPDLFSSYSSGQTWLALRNRFKACPGFLDMFPDTRVDPNDETVQMIQTRFAKEIVAKVELAVQLTHMRASCWVCTFYICSDGGLISQSKDAPSEPVEIQPYVQCLKDWLEGFRKN